MATALKQILLNPEKQNQNMKINKFKIIIWAILLLITSNGYAQFSYQKLVDKNKIDQAFYKANERWKSDRNDVSALYDLSTLYVLSNKKKKGLSYTKEKDNAERAYLYSQKASDAYSQAIGKGLKKLNRKGFDTKSLKKLNNKACYSLLKNAKTKNSIEVYEKLINKYSDCSYIVNKVDDLISEIAYKDACGIETKKAYQNFVKTYPLAIEIPLAEKKIKAINKKEQIETERANEFLSQKHDFSMLKAVLVVGTGLGTAEHQIKEMNNIAGFLIEKGIKTKKFYNEESDWEQIKEASKGAHFFIYMGHGTLLGKDGKVGGLVLKNMISSKQIATELQLSKNALVLFQSVCNGAGSSAGDRKELTVDQALTRVTDYAHPFVRLGASCYYANNYYSSNLKFLEGFFSGQSIKSCYIKSTQILSSIKIELEKTYPYNHKMKISISSRPSGNSSTVVITRNGVEHTETVPPMQSFNIAYVAIPDFTIMDLLSYR